MSLVVGCERSCHVLGKRHGYCEFQVDVLLRLRYFSLGTLPYVYVDFREA